MRIRLALLFGLLATAAWAQAARQDLSLLAPAEITALQRRLSDAGCYSGPLDGQASAATKAAQQACPDQRPRLVIETGMHIAAISSIAADRECKTAVTASYDKTFRLWSLPDGRLLRTMRPPVGDGNLGKFFASGFSPNGRFIAGAGWDALHEAKGDDAVYVFDAATGSIAATLGPLHGTIVSLAFSPDGKWMAVSSVGSGVVLFDTSAADPRAWRKVASPTTYEARTPMVAFGADGRLVTAAWDAKVRIFSPGPSFTKLAEAVTPGGKRPFAVAFDPAQTRIAVGYNDSVAVDLLDGNDLHRLGTANMAGIANGDSMDTAWTADGQRLWAAGRYYNPAGKFPALPFDRDGKKAGAPAVIGASAIFDMKNCGSNGLIWADGIPSFGLLQGGGTVTTLKTTIAPDMRRKAGDAFTISANAKIVRFGLDVGASTPVKFDLARASLEEAKTADPALAPSRVTGLPVTGWEDGASPALGSTALALDPQEYARAIAIRSDNSGFVLGASYYLRAFDSKGSLLWKKAGPFEAYGVNLSANGRVVVAAYGDGTLRWHRWSDGQELLAMFVNSQTRAWVAWTPTGYYSASPGGEDLIGWQINRGWNQSADFFPVDRFRTQFARPDIVDRILDTLDEAEAIKQANAARPVKVDATPLLQNLPPVISILSPLEGAAMDGASVTITYIIRSPSGLPVEAVEARVDGRPLPQTRGLGTADPVKKCLDDTQGRGRQEGALQGCRGSITIDAPQASAAISLAARSGTRFSEAAIVNLTRAVAQAGQTPAATDALKPKLYALVVGVADYINPAYKLGLPAKDAKDFAAALQHQKGGLYGEVTVQLLTDRGATLPAIKKGLEWLKRSTTARDVAILYFAGHGEVEQSSGGFYLLPAEADAQELFATALAREDVNRAVDLIAGKVVVFLDACHSAAIGGTSLVRGLGATNINDVVKDLANADNGVVLFTASTGKQLSLENPAWGNGAFTKAVVEGLGLDGIGAKANLLGKPAISLSELDAYVAARVKELTNGAQSPVMLNPKGVPNFPVALAR